MHRRSRHKRLRWPDILALVCLFLGVYHGAGAALIEGKARLAPVLIERAWEKTLQQPTRNARPWPWADTYPVGRLQAPGHRIDLPVLAGDSGNALAFAPGHASSSALPGAPGLVVIAGHRDTHFAFLRDVRDGDHLRLQGREGNWRAYRVVGTEVVDSRQGGWQSQPQEDAILLVTCYPFDALRPNGPLRYLVHARPAYAASG